MLRETEGGVKGNRIELREIKDEIEGDKGWN